MTVQAAAFPIFDPGGIAARKTVSTVQVLMTEGMHDTAIITLRSEATDAPELQPGTPVQMQYGWSPTDTDWFYGYIDHVESHYDKSLPDQSTFEDVVCLGASYALKDPFTGSWASVRASALVQQIAATYFLGSVVETDDFTWPQLANPGSSAWQFLAYLAQKNGYSLAVNKTLLRFISVEAGLRSYWANMPTFKTRNTAGSVAAQGVTNFQALTGETFTAPGANKAVRTVSGMNSAGQLVGAVNTGPKTIMGNTAVYPFFSQQVSSEVITSQASAQATLSGMAEANRFPYQATATLTGMTVIKQGMPIVLNGIDTNNDGIWWVREVTHKISSVGYSMDVCLGRNSKGDSGLRAVQTPGVAFSPKNPLAYTVSNAPPTKLVNNRWRSSTQFSVNVS